PASPGSSAGARAAPPRLGGRVPALPPRVPAGFRPASLPRPVRRSPQPDRRLRLRGRGALRWAPELRPGLVGPGVLGGRAKHPGAGPRHSGRGAPGRPAHGAAALVAVLGPEPGLPGRLRALGLPQLVLRLRLVLAPAPPVPILLNGTGDTGEVLA